MVTEQITRSRYDESTVDAICQRLRAGESLLHISKDPEMPSQRTLSDWVAKNHLSFAERYLEAKRVAAHFLADQLMEEARNDTNDIFIDEDGIKHPNHANVQRSKLICDSIKWQLARMLPKIYGDKITQELGVSGDLAKLMEAASNRDTGLPPPIDAEFEELPRNATADLVVSPIPDEPLDTTRRDSKHEADGNCEGKSHRHYLRGFKSAPSTPSNRRNKRRRSLDSDNAST